MRCVVCPSDAEYRFIDVMFEAKVHGVDVFIEGLG